MGGDHQYYIKPEYIQAMEELCGGLNITFGNVWERPNNTTDSWWANGLLMYRDIHYRNDEAIISWLQNWYNNLGGHCGMPHPVYPQRKDMLWYSPNILNANVREVPIDVLILNTPPTSGQCPEYEHGEFLRLGQDLRENGLYVLFAQWEGSMPYTITELAKLSIGARLIIQVANGPAFPCMNIWNSEVPRITLLHPMFLDYGIGLNKQARNVSEAREHCKTLGFL